MRLQPEEVDAAWVRLLGYPDGVRPGDRVADLLVEARGWYEVHGDPGQRTRELRIVAATGGEVRLETGTGLRSRALATRLVRSGARRLVVFGVTAGRAVEARVAALHAAGRAGASFVLGSLASAVAECQTLALSRSVGAAAAARGLALVARASPGHAGWDLAAQRALFDLLDDAAAPGRPPWGILDSGMLRPAASQLGVFGLGRARGTEDDAAPAAPCRACPSTTCSYRRTT